MVGAVEIRVESPGRAPVEPGHALVIRMLGRLRVSRDGQAVTLPPSRKVRALLGYLALTDNAVGRSRLCDLMGDVPSDPRGELRWYLSKLRAVLDDPSVRRVTTDEDMVALDLRGVAVDVLDIEQAIRAGLDRVGTDELHRLLDLFVGDFLEGLDLNRSPQLDHWVTTRRRHFRACHAAVLEQLISRQPPDAAEMRPLCETWVTLAPFEARAHLTLMAVLPSGEAELHLAAAERLFEAEDIDPALLRTGTRVPRAAPAAPTSAAPPASSPLVEPVVAGWPDRASLAVMPFREVDAESVRAGLGAGLTRDIIARLARLRALFVIAQGSVFALAERGIGPHDAGQRLNVDYIASGTVHRRGGHIAVAVELVEARSARIVWSDEFDAAEEDAFEVLERIGDTIVWSIASEVETAEKNRAILKPPNSLNAWEAYHRGLWHMYRFTRADNAEAQKFFQRSIQSDPTFARAHSGMSFTHWQNAFQDWEDRGRETDLAYVSAGRSLMIDDHDPMAHYAMGRAHWLRREQAQSIGELERAVDLSPNFALGHYALSFVHCQSGDPEVAIGSANLSQRLSPFDPLLFGMFGARAMAYVRLLRFDEAAEAALKAAARPNAHLVIQQIAAFCLALAGRETEARSFAASIRRALPAYGVDEFLRTFKFPADVEAMFRKGAARVGLT